MPTIWSLTVPRIPILHYLREHCGPSIVAVRNVTLFTVNHIIYILHFSNTSGTSNYVSYANFEDEQCCNEEGITVPSVSAIGATDICYEYKNGTYSKLRCFKMLDIWIHFIHSIYVRHQQI